MTFSNWLRKHFGEIEYSYADLLVFGTLTSIGSHGWVLLFIAAVLAFIYFRYIREHINEGNDND